MHALPLPHPTRPLKAHSLRARRSRRIRRRDGNALFPRNKPHGAQHTLIRTRADNSLEARVVLLVARALLAHRRRSRQGVVCTVCLVVLQHSDLAAAQDGFKGEADEELCGGGEEGCKGVSCRREKGIDAEGGAEDERGGC